ncbi:hypothetical protein J2S14_001690 [Lederbergia wuyishanensis]|uniref:Uncharacterized protein n=1 Tax=Lederbergia wuyishanensis TaxID=1347903 RepID=A0ABU0D3A4_9BACI|nr:hypothetical protein [Lederbergia wuyishanensis]
MNLEIVRATTANADTITHFYPSRRRKGHN